MFGDPRLPERFWSKCMPEPNTGCWLWTTGCDAKGGYSVFFVGGGTRRQTVAHKVAYEALIGPVPAGLVLDHLCRNRWCSNPMHLEVVSRGENVRRGINGALMTHCVRGHEVNEKNTCLSG